ncbi:MAG: redoxin domain-containing protein [Gammaproteobacteria bacterium]|nr:redoxin domain-containing protein [Gammaproteobacteria bacterium]NIW97698.1 redoxin domain-containing protein [Phycisphaerae bacterium]
MPVSDTAWGAFAEDFKVWCFGYDPATGSIQWIYPIVFTINPIILSLVILFVWAEPLKKVYSSPSIIKKHASLAFVLVASIAGSFIMMYETPDKDDLAFRPDSLRVELTPPEFKLTNHKEEEVSLSDFEDKVIILTSIYASCANTCPLILEQAKQSLDSLSTAERDEVVLIAITMQPKIDTPELLNQLAEYRKLNQYNTQLLTGEIDEVNEVLDKLKVSRYKMGDSSQIDHANIFMVIDRKGKIAYRFSLGDIQQEWMTEALRILVKEQEPAQLTEVK